MVTIKDVAKQAGVAISTVSYALNGNHKISPATRTKVLEAAKQLNYKKNGFASDLKKQSTKTIALILSDLSGPYYSEIIKGVQDTAVDSGYDLLACSSVGGRESTGIKFLKERRVDGAIVLSPFIPEEVLLEAARDGFPIVVVDRLINNDHLINIRVDNKKGGYKATEHLIQLGHKNIGFVSGPADTTDSQERFAGYIEALNDYQIPYQSKWHLPGQFTRESGYSATEILLAHQDLPSAVFYANDEMAIGGLKAIEKYNITVPGDLSIIGFDDIQLSEFVNPPLTTVRQPKYEVGSLCTRFLIRRLHQEDVEPNTKLSTELVLRSSTKAYKS